jgi:trk system potassium uptake protein TrkH
VIDFRPILFITGILMSTLSVAMCIPAIADATSGNPDWQVFAGSATLTLFIGVMLMLTMRSTIRHLTMHQAFVLTTLCWIVTPTFTALPFSFADLGLSYTDAFFEAMSGVTTTGATVITGLDTAPPGILLWRAILQWLGGIGIIAMAIAVLPMLRVGGMQLFRMESSDTSEKVLPRTAQITAWIAVIYLALTLLCALAYWLAGMGGFDAWTHAMTTIATGGFSTHDGSIGHFASPVIDTIATIFMLAGALPFVLYLRFIRGQRRALFTDSQVRLFALIAFTAVAITSIYLVVALDLGSLSAFRYAAFNVISMMTGTGYATANFSQWGSFAIVLLFFVMFTGGCAGSTTCGLKVFRLQVLAGTAITQIRQLTQPHGVFITYYNGKPVPESAVDSVMSFFFLYVACFTALAVALGLTGMDFLSAASGAASAIANVGPGLGPVIGPAGTYAPLEDSAKWILAGGMLLGRLELFTVLVLLAPAFWRR